MKLYKAVNIIFAVFALSILLAGCYTTLEHPVVEGYHDDQYIKQYVNFSQDCASCHSNEELAEYKYLASFEVESTYTSIEQVDNYTMFYKEIPWWFRYSPMITDQERSRYNDQAGNDDDNPPLMYPVRPAPAYSLPDPSFTTPGRPSPIRPAPPVKTTPPAKETVTKERDNTHSSSSGNSNTQRNSGRSSGKKKSNSSKRR